MSTPEEDGQAVIGFLEKQKEALNRLFPKENGDHIAGKVWDHYSENVEDEQHRFVLDNRHLADLPQPKPQEAL
jgi:hypothetical protein